MSSYNIAQLAERYQLTETEVEAKIEAWRRKAKTVLGDGYSGSDLDGFIESLIPSKLSSIFTLSGLEYAKKQIADGNADFSKIDTIIVAVSDIKDANDYNKREITSEWWGKKDESGKQILSEEELAEVRKKLVNEGKIEVRTGKTGGEYPVALDTTQKFKNGNDNPNYGKELEFRPQRTLYMIVGGKLMPGRGDFGGKDTSQIFYPVINSMSSVYGKLNQNETGYNLRKDAYEDDGLYANTYKDVYPILTKHELFQDAIQVQSELPAYKQFITIGEIWNLNYNDDGKSSVTIGIEGMERGIKLSTRYKPVRAYIDNLMKGQEVIVIGEKKTFTPEGKSEKVPYYTLWGIIVKPDAARDNALSLLNAKGL